MIRIRNYEFCTHSTSKIRSKTYNFNTYNKHCNTCKVFQNMETFACLHSLFAKQANIAKYANHITNIAKHEVICKI